ncbi:TIGR04222 domain-containing membrane protein [Nonomuraea sp. NPDC046570]|uniref:TIGR04222 domain-containing membrane protein n=1 Tax=Nonomuraea sp. NPDC046570 TaxID=3155255 RepID=UPI00340DF861
MGILLLIIAVIVVSGVIGVTTAIHREHRRVRAVVAAGRQDSFTPYELAYLSGGPRRVVNTALALMARQGMVRVSRGGNIHAVSDVRSAQDPVERVVLEAVSAHPGGVSAATLRHEVGNGPVMDGLRFHLTGLGLLLPDGSMTTVRTRVNILLLLVCASVTLLVAVIVALLADVVAWDAGTSLAALVLGVASMIGVVGHIEGRKALRNTLTSAGSDELSRLRRVHVPGATRSAAPEMAFAIGFPVALYGLSELDDPQLMSELGSENHRFSVGGGCAAGACGGGSSSGDFGGGDFGSSSGGSSSGGSSCSSGGGSSCSSGGCGGGGCGGG